MRKIMNLNRKWAFSKETTAVPTEISSRWNFVNLPHSWNAIDGQDGDNDYFRGTAYYAKSFNKASLPAAAQYYLEIRGANSSADVYLNGKKLEQIGTATCTFIRDNPADVHDLKAIFPR